MNHPYVSTVKVPLPYFCRVSVSFSVLKFQDQIRCLIRVLAICRAQIVDSITVRSTRSLPIVWRDSVGQIS